MQPVTQQISLELIEIRGINSKARLSLFPSQFLPNWLENPRCKSPLNRTYEPARKPVYKPLPGGGLKPASMQFKCRCDVCKH